MSRLAIALLVSGCSMHFSARTGPEKRHCYAFEGERYCFAEEQEMRDDYRERFRNHLNARRIERNAAGD